MLVGCRAVLKEWCKEEEGKILEQGCERLISVVGSAWLKLSHNQLLGLRGNYLFTYKCCKTFFFFLDRLKSFLFVCVCFPMFSLSCITFCVRI